MLYRVTTKEHKNKKFAERDIWRSHGGENERYCPLSSNADESGRTTASFFRAGVKNGGSRFLQNVGKFLHGYRGYMLEDRILKVGRS
jgi:hypothetical protein